MNFIQKFTKRDLGFAVLTGVLTGTIAWRVLEFLNVTPIHLGKVIYCISNGINFVPSGTITTGCIYQYNIPWVSLIIIVPIAWILGVMLGYFLGQWMNFFNQFGKFAAIGFTNFAVTAGVLNILLAFTNYSAGIGYAVISGASFLVGVLSSYIWNKYWAFKSNSDQGGTVQFAKFFMVTIIAFGVNVGIASLIVNSVHPAGFQTYPFGMGAHQWANIGTIAGSAAGLIFSFVGFKLAVFKQ